MFYIISAGCGGGGSPTNHASTPEPPPPAPTPVATSITVTPASHTLGAIGATVQLTATVRDQNNKTMTDQTVTWTSANTAVATVSTQGLVTAARDGTSQITARSGNASGSASITVAEPVATSITVTPASHTLGAVGATVQLTATVRDQNNKTILDAAVSWSSDDESVATVDDSGLVTAVGNGEAQITATSGSASSRVAVEVSFAETTLETPPPTWVFVEGVPASYQSALREEMERSRAYFSDRFGVEGTDFTVLVGPNLASLDSVFRETVGRENPYFDPPSALAGPFGFVTISNTGEVVVTLAHQQDLPGLVHIVVHEYFHVLQAQLNLKMNTFKFGAPRWLLEGLASYADYVYSQSTPDRRPFLGDRYSPWEDIANSRSRAKIGELTYLAELDDLDSFRCDFGVPYAYAMSFVASVFLLEQAQVDEEAALVTFWKSLDDRPWQQVFEEVFGLTAEAFYSAFDEWLPTRLPSVHLVENQMRYMEDGSFVTLDRSSWDALPGPYSRLDMAIYISPPGSYNVRAQGNSTNFLLIPSGAPLESAHIGLRLTAWGTTPEDQCSYLLGWYRDGELTDRLDDATPVEFTGSTTSLEWTLPDHPVSLPRKRLENWYCNMP